MQEGSGETESPKSTWREWARGRVPADPAAASARIVGHLLELLSQGQTVLTFWGMADEPNLGGLKGHGLRLALTRTPSEGPLTVHLYNGPLETHGWGFRQPVAGSPELPLEEVDVVLVPAVALGRDGSRLGHGKGYYDRLLSAMPGARRIGVAWECRVVPHLPTDPYDQMMHEIITESGPWSIGENP